MDSSLLLLPPHLLERIVGILREDVPLPESLRLGLQSAVDEAGKAKTELEEKSKEDTSLEQDDGVGTAREERDSIVEEVRPPVIEIEHVESLAKWAASTKGTKAIRRAKLDQGDYSLIALLAGTQVYYPSAKAALLKTALNPDKPNPYLPSHLSVGSAPLSGYKALNKQISTILNILFSIAGAGGALYVASVTGAGYSRETGVILGVIAALVVGVAEMILLWIFVWRIKEGRKRGIEQWKGSSAVGVKEADGAGLIDGDGEIDRIAEAEPEEDADRENGDGIGDAAMGAMKVGEAERNRTEVRLRRRAIGAPGAGK